MTHYVRLDAAWRALQGWLSSRRRRWTCFFSPPTLGHNWGSGDNSWYGGPGCACGAKQSASIIPGE